MSQIEALPPSNDQPASLMPTTLISGTHLPNYNSAIRHPVFFTERLRKPPFPLPAQANRGSSPVVFGYVWDAKVTEGGARTNQGKPNL
ncbi:MAG: hypothetical protein M1835_001481 [Candelina submexicana]|nr:MAG: hypothetical protein M1835_001481 [Candelina submexicana]